MTPDITGIGRLFPLSQAAAQIGIGHSTLRRWASEGRVKTFKIGRARRISEAEITRLLQGGFQWSIQKQ